MLTPAERRARDKRAAISPNSVPRHEDIATLIAAVDRPPDLPAVVASLRALLAQDVGRARPARHRMGPTGPLVWVLGTCGLRLQEAIGLDATDVDRPRRRLRIRASVAKNRKAREVPISDYVLAMLPEVGTLFCGLPGRRLNGHNWRERVFRPAALSAGLGPMHPHELRHTAASLAIASGADVKAVQRMLGHASAALTLDLYGHLFDAQLDTVAVAMDEARQAAMDNVVPLRTGRNRP